MWMMGCSDVSDSFIGRKVRPHIPRPTILNPAISPSTTTNINNVANHPYLGRIHGGDLLVYNHHLLTEQSKRDYDVPTLVSSRWNPTPEQLQTLEELYRRGTRTPSAEQIQHITAQLRRFGKIEGKNVFYWFQNHKARERQKRRRRSEHTEEDEPQLPILQHAQNSGSSRTSGEVEQQAKNYWPWGFSSVTSTLTEVRDYQESVSMQSADRADRAERIQFDHEEGQVQNRRFMNSRVPTWLPSSLFTPTTTSSTLGTLMTEDLNMFLKTQREYEDKKQESHTLQLFPLRKDDEEDDANQDGKESGSQCNEVMNSNGCPKQFFEFL